jgi:hypothetical protein
MYMQDEEIRKRLFDRNPTLGEAWDRFGIHTAMISVEDRRTRTCA